MYLLEILSMICPNDNIFVALPWTATNSVLLARVLNLVHPIFRGGHFQAFIFLFCSDLTMYLYPKYFSFSVGVFNWFVLANKIFVVFGLVNNLEGFMKKLKQVQSTIYFFYYYFLTASARVHRKKIKMEAVKRVWH